MYKRNSLFQPDQLLAETAKRPHKESARFTTGRSLACHIKELSLFLPSG
jgi:hypothetical protein